MNTYFDNVKKKLGFGCMRLPMKNGTVSDCIKCGKCEKICPQHLNIRELINDVAVEFEK